MAAPMDLLTEGFKLNLNQRGLLIRVGWVMLMSIHVAWICGFLTAFGLAPPFAAAADLQPITKRVESIESLLRQSLMQSKARDVRDLVTKLCDPKTLDRDRLYAEKDRLQIEYKALAGEYYAEPPCERLR